ncbi:MAG: DJ-1/PfpI family protein [Leptospiraceae bacterium]|nr:DJ-1/PfpI family protein [Leptospiraceae bacterium]
MILMPLSSKDYDPTEASIVWKMASRAGHEFEFATSDARPATADPRMITGEGLGPWKGLLRAREDAIRAQKEMSEHPSYLRPVPFADINPDRYEAIVLHGGHAPGMRPYLESEILQDVIAQFARAGKPVAAICHGVVLLGRSRDAAGRSVLYEKRCTTLLRSQEMAAYNLTRLWLGTYYRTYPETTCQEEVTGYLKSTDQFQEGPRPLLRDSNTNLKRGFAVQDGNILTARWPGDAYAFSTRFLTML